jgi:hypothetical protein
MFSVALFHLCSHRPNLQIDVSRLDRGSSVARLLITTMKVGTVGIRQDYCLQTETSAKGLLTSLSTHRQIQLEGRALIHSQAMRLGAIVLLSVSAVGQSEQPREPFDHSTVLYDWVTNDRGEKLRTFVTRPA